MKTRVLLTVLALTCGAAFAQAQGGSASRDATVDRNNASTPATANSPSKSADDGIVAKTKRALSNMGDKIRNAGNKAKNSDDKTANTTSRGDTRSMGAAGSDASDAARRSRMDDAYANSKSKQQQQQK